MLDLEENGYLICPIYELWKVFKFLYFIFLVNGKYVDKIVENYKQTNR